MKVIGSVSAAASLYEKYMAMPHFNSILFFM